MVLTYYCASITECASSFACQVTSVLQKDCDVRSCSSLQLLLQKGSCKMKGEINLIGVKYESIFQAPLDLLKISFLNQSKLWRISSHAPQIPLPFQYEYRKIRKQFRSPLS